MPISVPPRLPAARLLSAAGGMLALLGPAGAQESAPPPDPPTELVDEMDEGSAASAREDDVTMSLRDRVRYTFETGFDDDRNDDFSVWRLGLGYELAIVLTEKARLRLDLGYEYNNYDFAGPNIFLAGTNDPFSEIHVLEGTLTTIVATDDPRWSWFAGINGQFAGEKDVDLGDAGTVGGLGGVRWQASDDLALTFGVFARTEIEDDPQILPLLGVDWRIDDRWRLRAEGPGGELLRGFEGGWEAAIGGAWENRRFRLEEGGATRSSVVEDTSVPVFARLGYRPEESNLEFDLVVGAILFQEFEIEDRNGDNGRTFETEAAPFVEVGLRWTF